MDKLHQENHRKAVIMMVWNCMKALGYQTINGLFTHILKDMIDKKTLDSEYLTSTYNHWLKRWNERCVLDEDAENWCIDYLADLQRKAKRKAKKR